MRLFGIVTICISVLCVLSVRLSLRGHITKSTESLCSELMHSINLGHTLLLYLLLANRIIM